MNEPIAPVPSPVETPPVSSLRPSRLIFALVGVVVLAGLVAGGWYLYQQLGFSNTLPKGAHVQVSLGIVPVGQVFSLNKNTLMLEESPLAEGQVIDMVVDGTTKYYLIGDAATRTSNIYSTDGGALTKKTNSPTLKFNLTFDSATKTFAYMSGEVASTTLESFVLTPWKLTLFSEASGERTLPGAGGHAVFLPGGTHLLIANGGKIELVQVSSGVRSALLTLEAGAPFAVTPDGTSLALFNRTTGALDYFSLSGTAASYVRSQKVTGVPLSLSFADAKTLIMVTSSEKRDSMKISVVGGASLNVSNPVSGLLPQKITISYE